MHNPKGVSINSTIGRFPLCECRQEDSNKTTFSVTCRNCRVNSGESLAIDNNVKTATGTCPKGYEANIGLQNSTHEPKIICCTKQQCINSSNINIDDIQNSLDFRNLIPVVTGYDQDKIKLIKETVPIYGRDCDPCIFGKFLSKHNSTCANGYYCVNAGDPNTQGWSPTIGHCTPAGKPDLCSVTKQDAKKHGGYSDNEIRVISENGTDCDACVFNTKSTPNYKAGSTCANGYHCVHAGNSKDNGWSEKVGICHAAGKPEFGSYTDKYQGRDEIHRIDVCACKAIEKGLSALKENEQEEKCFKEMSGIPYSNPGVEKAKAAWRATEIAISKHFGLGYRIN